MATTGTYYHVAAGLFYGEHWDFNGLPIAPHHFSSNRFCARFLHEFFALIFLPTFCARIFTHIFTYIFAPDFLRSYFCLHFCARILTRFFLRSHFYARILKQYIFPIESPHQLNRNESSNGFTYSVAFSENHGSVTFSENRKSMMSLHGKVPCNESSNCFCYKVIPWSRDFNNQSKPSHLYSIIIEFVSETSFDL